MKTLVVGIVLACGFTALAVDPPPGPKPEPLKNPTIAEIREGMDGETAIAILQGNGYALVRETNNERTWYLYSKEGTFDVVLSMAWDFWGRPVVQEASSQWPATQAVFEKPATKPAAGAVIQPPPPPAKPEPLRNPTLADIKLGMDRLTVEEILTHHGYQSSDNSGNGTLMTFVYRKDDAFTITVDYKTTSNDLFDRVDTLQSVRTEWPRVLPELIFDEAAAAGETTPERAPAAEADSNDPQSRMELGQKLARQGKRDQALAEYLWCFDHGLEHDEAFGGVRLSFLLSNIVELGDDHPPAIEALEARRKAAAAKLIANGRSYSTAMEVVAITDALEDDYDLVALLDSMPAKSKLARQYILSEVLAPLAERRDYAKILDIGGYEFAKDQLETSRIAYEGLEGISSLEGIPEDRRPELKAMLAEHRTKSLYAAVLPAYEALVNAERADDAEKLSAELTRILPGDETKDALAKAAERVKKVKAD